MDPGVPWEHGNEQANRWYDQVRQYGPPQPKGPPAALAQHRAVALRAGDQARGSNEPRREEPNVADVLNLQAPLPAQAGGHGHVPAGGLANRPRWPRLLLWCLLAWLHLSLYQGVQQMMSLKGWHRSQPKGKGKPRSISMVLGCPWPFRKCLHKALHQLRMHMAPDDAEPAREDSGAVLAPDDAELAREDSGAT
eukprot:s1331_g10.t1